jgi:hypothetical protein
MKNTYNDLQRSKHIVTYMLVVDKTRQGHEHLAIVVFGPLSTLFKFHISKGHLPHRPHLYHDRRRNNSSTFRHLLLFGHKL